MSRTGWTPEEVRGHQLVWLVTLEFAGLTLRMATLAVDVNNDAGSLAYVGTLEELEHQETMTLFSLQAEGEEIVVEGMAPCDVPTLAAEGHRLEGCAVEVAQVRARVTGHGATAVDAWEDRCVLLTGTAVQAQWGAYKNGASFVRFAARRPDLVNRRKMPPLDQRVNRSTWPTGGLSDEDLNVAYPLVFGYPGRDTLDQDGVMPAARVAWLTKELLYHVICVGLAPMDAATIRVFHKDAPIGVSLNVGTSYDTGAAVIESRDPKNCLVYTVDYHSEGYYTGGGNQINDVFQPPVQEGADDHVFWGLGDATGGGYLWRGEVIRNAADVLAYALVTGGIAVDVARFESARAQLDRFKIDHALTVNVDPLDWVKERLLPILPVSLAYGNAGLYPVVFDPSATAADVVLTIDCQADPQIEAAELVEEDASHVENLITLSYGYNARTQKYRYTRRYGPTFVDSTDYASAEIRSEEFSFALGYGRVLITWGEAGSAGEGVTVTCTDTGAESATYTSATRTLAVTFDGTAGGSASSSDAGTLETTVDAVAEVTARALGNTTSNWGTTSTPFVTLHLNDYGTTEHPACSRSVSMLAQGDVPGPLAGVREAEIETDLVYDHDTARAILDWRAAAYAPIQRRLSFGGPEATLCGLRLGDLVAYVDTQMALNVVGRAEAIHRTSAGQIGIRLVVLDG